MIPTNRDSIRITAHGRTVYYSPPHRRRRPHPGPRWLWVVALAIAVGTAGAVCGMLDKVR